MGVYVELLKYEILKVFKNKKFFLFFGGIILLNLGLLYYFDNLDNNIPLNSYKILSKDIEGLKDREKEDYLNKYLNSINEESKLLYTENFESEHSLVNEVLEDVKKVNGYNKFLEGIKNRGDKLSEISIFKEGVNSKFSKENIEKTKKDYEAMKGVVLSYEEAAGIKFLEKFYVTDILLMLTICIVVYVLVLYEKERKIASLIKATKYGRITSITSKIVTLAVAILLTVLILYLINIGYIILNFKPLNLSKEIQSLAPFVESTLNISIKTYIVLYIVLKSIAFLFIGSILIFLGLTCRYIIAPYLGISFLIAISYFMNTYIRAISKWNILKYFNLIGILDTNLMLGEYLNLNIFGNAVNYKVVIIILMISFIIILNIGSIVIYKNFKRDTIKKINIKGRRFKIHNNLFFYEMYKILIMKKGLIIGIMFFLISGYFYMNHSYFISRNEIKYKDYIRYLEGPLTKGHEEFIKNEKIKFEKASKNIEDAKEKYEKKEIEFLECEKIKEENEKVLRDEIPFKRVLLKYKNIKDNKAEEFLYDTGYKMFFNVADKSMKPMIILYFLTIIFILSQVFTMEYENSKEKLLKPSFIGIRKIRKLKFIISIIIIEFFLLMTLIFRFIHISKYYGLDYFFKNINSIFLVDGFLGNISIGLFFIGVFILLSICSICIVLFILEVSKRFKNSIYTMVIGGIISMILVNICL